VRLAYFDTNEGRYRTLETKPMHITAVKSSHPSQVAAGDQPSQQQDIQILGKDIAHIHADVPIRDALTPLWARGLFMAMMPLPLVAAVGATVLRRRRDRLAGDVALARSSRARKLAKKTLAAASRHLHAGEGLAFYAEISRALQQYVGDKLNVSAIGMLHEVLQERVEAASASPELAARLVAMLERCDMARFAPGSMGGERLRETLEEAESLIVELDAHLGRRRAPSPVNAAGATLALLLALAVASWSGGARAQTNGGSLLGSAPATSTMPAAAEYAPPAELIARGHAAYEAGHFADAVAAYSQAERAGVRNGPLYYDLGNAYFKNNELGEAIAAYRRAEMLSPRDPLVHANLEFALARREDKAIQARTLPLVDGVVKAFRSLSLNEWILSAALLYVVVCGLWIAGTLGRSRGAAWRWSLRVGAGLLALSLVTVGFKAHVTRGIKRGVVSVSKVDVTSGPGRTYTVEFSLHEGAELRIEERRPEWVRVSVSEKLRGWVPAASVVQI
jgi:tetratricopeptide (TPR) repeat protein